jgi:hypothetical protein
LLMQRAEFTGLYIILFRTEIMRNGVSCFPDGGRLKREAGANPARSRHCEGEGTHIMSLSSTQLRLFSDLREIGYCYDKVTAKGTITWLSAGWEDVEFR